VTEHGHPIMELQDLLDGVLDDARTAEVQAHMAGCEACSEEYFQLSAGRDIARSMRVQIPDGLSAKIVGVLDEEDLRESSGKDRQPGVSGLGRQWRWFAAAAVLVIGFVLVWLATSTDPGSRQTPPDPVVVAVDLADDIASDYAAYRDGRLRLAISTTDSAELERYFEGSTIEHDVRVLDLVMMQYGVAGGQVLPTEPPRAMFVYNGPDNVRLMCQMFLLDYAGLPDGGEHQAHNDIEFVIYERNEITIVFWMEGDVMCALSSDIGREEVVALAFAKAMAAIPGGV